MTVMLYNLVVRADESRPMRKDRMLQKTDSNIRALFTNGEEFDLQALAQYPTILSGEFKETDSITEAVVGYIDIPSLNPQISRPIMRFPSRLLLDQGLLEQWENTHTCWRVLRGDPYKLLSDAGILSAQPLDALSKVDSHLISVMMPFKDDPKIDPVFKAIEGGVKSAGFECRRVDQIVTPTDITEDILELICKSYAVIVDLSGMNPNVLYELGFAQGKGKETILLSRDSPSSLPFDINHKRTIKYERTELGLEGLSKKLTETLTGMAKRIA